MTPSTLPAPARRKAGLFARSLAVFCIATFTAAFATVTFAAAHLGQRGDAARLRDAARGDDAWGTLVSANAGPVTFALARAVCVFTPADADVRDALGALRGVSVSVLRRSSSLEADRSGLAARCDAALGPGWTRAVTVLDGDENVLVYVGDAADSLEVCVAVVTPDELIVCNATVEPERLARIVARHTGRVPWGDLVRTAAD